MSRIKRNAAGQVTLEHEGGSYILNPKSITRQLKTSRTRNTSESSKSLFKLVTVRRLEEKSNEEIAALLAQSQQQAAAAALASGQPVPYPAKPPKTESDRRNFFAVYVDEDLPGGKTPVYSFYSPSAKIRAFVTANGLTRKDWSIHIVYYSSIKEQGNGSSLTNWVLFSLDNKLDGVGVSTSYLLNSISLPDCYNVNFDINSLDYVGGGCWSGIAIDEADKIKVIGWLPPNRSPADDNFKPIYYNPTTRRWRVVLYQSTTPSYQFSWCRGELQLNYRERDSSRRFNPGDLINNGVLTTDYNSYYKLKLNYRPILQYNDITVVDQFKEEYSLNSASYVGNTNLELNSPFQSPDYGTDKPMYSLRRYTQESKIIRPKKNSWSWGGRQFSSRQQPSIITIGASSPDMRFFLAVDYSDTGVGDIDHPYQLKYSTGERGIQHYYDYPIWWAYGPVLSVAIQEATNTIYKASRAGPYEERGYFEVDTFTNRGEVLIHPTIPNAVLTTWEENPPAALGFGKTSESGILKFNIAFNNPPLVGHEGVFYYHKNPLGGNNYGDDTQLKTDNFGDEGVISDGSELFSMSGNLTGGGLANTGDQSPLNQLRGLQNIYNQIIGQTTNQYVPSIHIGNVNPTNDANSVVCTRPTEPQQNLLYSFPHLFPNGFFNSRQSISINNSNEIIDTRFDSTGTPIKTYTSNSVVET